MGIKPNYIIVISVLPTCAYLLALEQLKQIHGHAIRIGFEPNEVGSWNVLIVGYLQIGLCHEALTFFNEMKVILGIKPISNTVVSVVFASA
jgi:pentatricopeptide repeat protein